MGGGGAPLHAHAASTLHSSSHSLSQHTQLSAATTAQPQHPPTPPRVQPPLQPVRELLLRPPNAAHDSTQQQWQRQLHSESSAESVDKP
jgi:hypothetical protein